MGRSGPFVMVISSASILHLSSPTSHAFAKRVRVFGSIHCMYAFTTMK